MESAHGNPVATAPFALCEPRVRVPLTPEATVNASLSWNGTLWDDVARGHRLVAPGEYRVAVVLPYWDPAAPNAKAATAEAVTLVRVD